MQDSMVDPPLAPARPSNHWAMRMEGPRFHTGRPVPCWQRTRPHSRGDDHNHLTTGRHPQSPLHRWPIAGSAAA